MENRGGFNRGISEILNGADFKAAQDLYPEILKGCGVSEKDIDRSVREVVGSIKGIKRLEVNDATKTRMAKSRTDVFVSTIDALTSPKRR